MVVARYLDGTPLFTVDKTLRARLLLVTGKDFTHSAPVPARPPTSPLHGPTTTTTIDPRRRPPRSPTTLAGMVPEPPDGEVCG